MPVQNNLALKHPPESSLSLLDSPLDFSLVMGRLEQEVLSHAIISFNPMTSWWKEGQLDLAQVQKFTVQFSVFSNLFLVAQLKKMLNAPDLASMRSSKEILASEIGVVFKSPNKSPHRVLGPVSSSSAQQEVPLDLVQTAGSIEGGTFRFRAAHFEWLVDFAAPLGLTFPDLGKRKQGIPSTLFFTDALERLLGHEDYSVSAGASFALENWAARGFWKELIRGLELFKEREQLPLKMGFFVWHDLVEDQHAEHTQDELREVLEQAGSDFCLETFIGAGKEMMEALQIFWQGLLRHLLQEHK